LVLVVRLVEDLLLGQTVQIVCSVQSHRPAVVMVGNNKMATVTLVALAAAVFTVLVQEVLERVGREIQVVVDTHQVFLEVISVEVAVAVLVLLVQTLRVEHLLVRVAQARHLLLLEHQ
jgi:hypothetical protein